jgi:hypothetical protein
MVDLAIPAAAQPRDVATLFEAWALAKDQAQLELLLPPQPLHAWTIVLLGAMAADRRERGLATKVSLPEASSLRHVLSTFAAKGSGPAHVDPSHGFLELLQPIRDLKAARAMSDKAGEALERVIPPASPSIARMARFVFEELGANVVQHSGRPETGFGFTSVEASDRRLELAFADAGVGFRASLQRNPELEGRVSDDAEALQLALNARITGTSAPRTNMGIGLKTLTDFSDLLGGELWIASGSALLQRRTTAGQRTNVVRSIAPWPGTWISLDAPLA